MLIIFSSLYSQYYCWNTDFEKCYSTRVCWEGFNRCAFQAIAPFSHAQISLVFIVLDYCRTWSGQEMATVTCNLRSQKSAPSMVMWSRYVSFAPLSLLVLAAPKCHLLTSDSTEHFILEPTSGSSFALPHHLTLWLSDSPGSSGGRGHPNLHWVFKNRVGNKRWGDFLLIFMYVCTSRIIMCPFYILSVQWWILYQMKVDVGMLNTEEIFLMSLNVSPLSV